MPKYVVTVTALFHEGRKYKRGDILDTEVNYGTRVEPYTEPVVEPVKPKRKRRTKAEMQADEDQRNV